MFFIVKIIFILLFRKNQVNEFYLGNDLFQNLKVFKRFEEGRAFKIFRSILMIFNYLHKK